MENISKNNDFETNMVTDNEFYVEIPMLDFFDSSMVSSLGIYGNNLYLELFEFKKNNFILPLELDKLVSDSVSFDIFIKKDGCNYTEILRDVTLSKVNRSELRRNKMGDMSVPHVYYVEGEITKKEYIKS
ncbi:MAG: hypothetical protein IKT40_07345 [Bacilli bacterium]|nr:hypothetical protein [Bacilli bacterium]